MSEQLPVGAGKTAIIYTRVPQYNEVDRTTVAVQLTACRQLAARLGYQVTAAAIVQDDTPNMTMNRPGITTLIGLIASGQAGAVITYRLDRLGRAGTAGLEALLKELRRRALPLYLARTPKGYAYDPRSGRLEHDPALVAEANREPARPPEYIVLPRENERGDLTGELRDLAAVLRTLPE